MSANPRPYFLLKTQASTSVRFKYAIGIGALASLALAIVMFSRYEPDSQYMEIKKVPLVKITPIHTPPITTSAQSSRRKEIEEVVQLQASLAYEKSQKGLARKQALAKQVKLLRELEDLQLKISLHADDPNFNHEMWTTKYQSIEKNLTPATH